MAGMPQRRFDERGHRALAVGAGDDDRRKRNCAFTVAWFRPDRFRRVISLLGSFAQVPGGDPYPDLIRESPPKPLRIFMLAETHDLDWGPDGNWLKENLLVAAALAERGYDFRLVLGDGGHDGNHGGVILPDALRWLWRPEPE